MRTLRRQPRANRSAPHLRSTRHPRTALLGAGAALAALVLVGCAGSSGAADSVYAGVPEGASLGNGDGPAAAWLGDGERFAVVTMGSSSCPSVATELAVEAADHLTLAFAPSSRETCTADLSPTTHEFRLPNGITERPVTITVSYESWDGTSTLLLE